MTYRIEQKYTKHTTIYKTIIKVPKEHYYTATLRYTSRQYTSLHLSTLYSVSFALHYPLIWLKPITFPIVLFHLKSLN
jgi:Neuraminidase (sialidase)